MRLELAQMIRKARHRLPRSVGGARLWLTLQDHLVASHHLSSRRRHELMQAWGRCRTPGDYFDFASRVLPSHQVRSEILSFLGLARSRAPRTVMEIGTAEGGTNFLLGAALPDVTLKIAVDLHVQNTKLLRAFTRPGLEQVFVHASSYAPATVDRVHGLLDGRPLDLLFIDGGNPFVQFLSPPSFHYQTPDLRLRQLSF